MEELTIKEITNFDVIYPRYQEDFPLDEQKSYEKVTSLLKEKKYKILLAMENEKIKGYMIGIERDHLFWMDYLAVIKESRGSGIGTRFLAKLKEKYDTILFEVEINDGIEGSQKDKREKFYLRSGGKILDVPYALPTKEGSLRMNLFMISSHQPNMKKIQEFVRFSVSTIHSDYAHTPQVIEKYISWIQ